MGMSSQQLWAPWRFEYIRSASAGSPGDIFLELPLQDDDEKNLILHRGRTAFVIFNRFPYTSGHLMVAPFRQTADPEDLTDDELLEINQLVRDCVRWLRKGFSPDGFNIGINLGSAGGAGIPTHIHWHIVPRWSGDTNFMTTVGEVRVIPQALDESYRLLREIIESEGMA